MKALPLFLVVCVTAVFAEELATVGDDQAHQSGSSVYTLMKLKVNSLRKQVQTCELMLRRCQHKVFKDCRDAYDKGMRKNGVYPLKPDNGKQFKAYCDMSKGGYTVFQRRKDGSVNFYRSWSHYLKGFGKLKGEHWLGLDKIYRLTKSSRSVLRVDIGDYRGATAYALYQNFYLDNAATRFKLHVTGYSGTAGDALSYHNGKRFSTYDRDYDTWSSGSCATVYKGAWWFGGCHHSDLNGLFSSTRRHGAQYISWYYWKRNWYSLKTSEMSIRRK